MASTVLDVSVFLLCVAGSVLLLGTAGGSPPAEPDPAADRVAATTATVDYAVRPRGPNGTARPPAERTVHGTLGGLLARAALAAATVDGRPLSPAADAFVAAVTGTVRGRLPPRTSVVAIYEPYPGASVRGTVRAGRPPPADAAVRGTTLTVPTASRLSTPPSDPSGAPSTARAGAPNGSVGEPTAPAASRTDPAVVARLALRSLFPRHPGATTGGDRAYLAGRCARFAAALGVDTRGAGPIVGSGRVRGSPGADDGSARTRPCGDAVAERFAARVERELAASPAEGRIAPDRVRIVVRTW